VLLTAPETPLLFMGQEWAAGTPFHYFTDHHEELGRLVTEGRRREFKYFSAFADPEARARIPDPQAAATFEASRLDWTERDREPHAAMLRLYRALLALRRREPALRADAFHATAIDDGTIAIRRDAPAESLLAIARLTGAGVVDLDEERLQRPDAALAAPEAWTMVLSSESADYSPTPLAPDLDVSVQPAKLRFLGPSAVILRARLR
jgi:maltooligosyltrehalose trehalohydrolase